MPLGDLAGLQRRVSILEVLQESALPLARIRPGRLVGEAEEVVEEYSQRGVAFGLGVAALAHEAMPLPP